MKKSPGRHLRRLLLAWTLALANPAGVIGETKTSFLSAIFPNLWNDPTRWTSSGEPATGDNVFIGPAVVEPDLPEINLPILYVSSRPEDTILGTLTINAPALQVGFQTTYFASVGLPLALPDFSSFFPRGIHQAGGVLRTTNELIGTTQYGYFLQTGGLHTVEEDAVLGQQSGGLGAYLYDGPIDSLFRVRRDLIVGDAGDGFYQQFLGWLIVQRDFWFGKQAGGEGIGLMSGPVHVWRDLTIGGAGAGRVIFNDELKIDGSLFLGRETGSSGILNNGPGARLNITGNAMVGDAGIGDWQLTPSLIAPTVAGNVVIGNEPGSFGRILMTSSSFLIVGQDLTVGAAGAGLLEAISGDAVEVAGNLTLGAAATGAGELTMHLNSAVSVTGDATLGGLGSASILVNGASTLAVAGDVRVGDSGSAEVTANISSLDFGQSLSLAHAPGSTATLRLLGGSELVVAGDATIGRAGGADLVVGGSEEGNAGIALFDGTLDVGTQANGSAGSGQLVLNQGFVEVDGFTRVGLAGTGTWQQSGGQAIFNSTFSLGHEFTGSGTLNLSGGTMQGTNLLLQPWGASAAITGGRISFDALHQAGGSLEFQTGQDLAVTLGPAAGHRLGGVTLVDGTLAAPAITIAGATLAQQGGTIAASVLTLEAGGVLDQQGGSLVTQEMHLNAGTVRGELHNTGVLTVAPGVDFRGALNNFSDFDLTGEFSPQDGMIVSGGYTEIDFGDIYSGGPVEVRAGGHLELGTGAVFQPQWDLRVSGGHVDVSGDGIVFEPEELIITGGMTTFSVSAASALDLTRTTLRFGSESTDGSDLIIGYSEVPNILPGGRTMYWSGSMNLGADGASRLFGNWTVSTDAALRIEGVGDKKLMEQMTNHGNVNWVDGDVLGTGWFTNHGSMIVSATGDYWHPRLRNHGSVYVDNAGGAHFTEIENYGTLLITPIVPYVTGGMYVLGPYSGAGTITGHPDSSVDFSGGGTIAGTIEEVRATFSGGVFEVANAGTALGTAAQVRLTGTATLELLHIGGGPLAFGNDFDLRSGTLEVEGATDLNFSGAVKLGAPGSVAAAPVLPSATPVNFLAGSSVEIQGLDDDITLAAGATGLLGGAQGHGQSRNTGTIHNAGDLAIVAAGSLSNHYDPLAELSYDQANAKEIVGGGRIVNDGTLEVDFGLVSGSSHLAVGGTVRAAGKISQDLVNQGDAVIRGVAHPDLRLAWWDGLIENSGDLQFERGWLEANQLRQISGTSSLGNVSLRTTQGLSVEGGTLSTNGTFLQSNVSVTDTGRVTVGPDGLLVYGTFADAPASTVHLQGRFASGGSFLSSFKGTLILDGPGAGIYAANAVLPSNSSGAPSISGSFGTNLTPTLTTVPAGATLSIRNGYNITGGENWTTHGKLEVGAGSTFTRGGGTLGGGGEIRVLSGGSMVLGGFGNWGGPAGAIVIDSGGSLSLSPGYHRFHGRTLTNHGTATHTADSVYLDNTSVIANHGTWSVALPGTGNVGGYRTESGYIAGGSFINHGTFNQNGLNVLDFGSYNTGPGFTNHGIVNVNSGKLAIYSQGVFSGSSVVSIAAGAELQLRDGTNSIQDGARFQGAGVLGLGDGGNTTLSGTVHADNASFWGGTIHGTHTLTGTWNKSGSGGSMATTGTTTIGAGATWNFQASTNLRGRTFVNQGTVHRTDGQLEFNPDTLIQNHGTWNDANQGNSYASQNSPQGGLFENFGTFNKTAAGTLSFASGSGGPAFTNHGTLNVNQGILSIRRASSFSGTSVANLAAGTALELRDGSNNLQHGARFLGAGTLSLGDAGNHTLSGTIHADNASFWGGTLHGTHTLTGTWNKSGSGGNMGTVGTTTIGAGATWNFQASTNLRGRTFVNQGTVNRSDGQLEFSPDTLIQNHGTWNDANQGNSYASQNSPQGGLFENHGTFNKTATGTLSFASGSGGPGFTNHGTVNVNQGILSIRRTSTFSGTSVANLAAGATLELRDGTNHLQDGARFQGAGLLAFGDAGQHHVNGSIHADNAMIGGGTLHGTHTLHGNWSLSYYPNIATTGTTTIAADGTWRFEAATNHLGSRSFVNHGAVSHTSGHLSINAASVITNHGTWTESSGANFLSSGDRVGLVENRGTFIKTGANTVAMDYYNGPVFSNLGTVDVQQGTLQLYRNLAQHTGSTLTGGTWIVRNGAVLRDDYTTAYTVNQADVTIHGTGDFAGFAGLTRNEGAYRLHGGKTHTAAAPFTNPGTLIVGAGSTFSSPAAFANSGSLAVAGSFASSYLSNTGLLRGTGNVHGPVFSAGDIAPGESPGLLTFTGSLTLEATSRLLLELGGTGRGTTYDAFEVTGTLALGGTLAVSFIDAFSPSSGATFNLFDAGSITGTFSSVELPALTPGLMWDQSALAVSGVLSVTGSPIPEPSTYAALAGLAALGLAAWRRRKGKNS